MQEDKTKSMRQWRFTSKEEVNEKDLEYILEAIENEKQGKIIKTCKKEMIVSELLERNDSKPSLKEAFKSLPLQAVRVLEYIESAKQEKRSFRESKK
jgi:hypothetical protein